MWSGVQSVLRAVPGILYDVLIRAIGRPVEYVDIMRCKPGFCVAGGVLWVVIVLEDDLVKGETLVLQGSKEAL